MASLAALALAILAARSSPDLAQAAVAAAQYATYQTAVNFTRDNEREADRVGVQILDKSGFDPHAMPAFLERLQRSYRLYRDQRALICAHPPVDLRADRGRAKTVWRACLIAKCPTVSTSCWSRARLQAREMSPRDGVAFFDDILTEKKVVNEASGPLRTGHGAAAEEGFLARHTGDEHTAGAGAGQPHRAGASRGGSGQPSGDIRGALDLYATRSQALSPQSCPDLRLCPLADRHQAVRRMRCSSSRPRSTTRIRDHRLYELQAECYAHLGQKLQQHRSLAEAYTLIGSLPAAIDQLQLGLKAGDGDFYQLSSAEARLKELRAADAERRKEQRSAVSRTTVREAVSGYATMLGRHPRADSLGPEQCILRWSVSCDCITDAFRRPPPGRQ